MWKAKKPLEFIISSTLKSLEDMREELKYVYMDISDWQKKGKGQTTRLSLNPFLVHT